MKRYLLDSNAISRLMDKEPYFVGRLRETRVRGGRAGVCEPVVGELYYGLELSASQAAKEKRLQVVLAQLPSWPFDRAAARQYGRLAAHLKRVGRLMQTIDMQLAAVALTLGNTVVVSSDTDLLAVPGLTVENWAAE